MTEQSLRDTMVMLGASLFARGYATGGAGNLSARLPDGTLIATPTGSCLGRLEADRLAKVSLDGRHLDGDRPSKEVAFHLALYHNNPECQAVVHLHCTHLTALSCLDGLNPANVIRPFTPYYVMRVGSLPLIPYYKPGDARIAEELGRRAQEAGAFLLANHGPVVMGKNLVEAVNNMEELEETARLALLLHGQPIRYLSESEVAELRSLKP
ncbi:3-oxo-tetronate 4-phosphate decarboxylase [Aeromonas rivuli]|jgi:3-dehydro-4-phosphotetronate decarboxylase|uniref:3-oxo-tetronate 4-phosphate decarboxylase n=1 Tax=Aeromonas TaxID=642 RepID=UPI0005A8D765|nr:MULTISPECIES: aldolase [Aeromonas]MCS3454704.1 ribulose-5-phosphate 4-epimerase/fuculose-1-phosphate aldolase [Aeromonas sp. BIGb0405]MCS3459673.1 ribulose-5-phosphate 4-epimerase/fuculose-1-phosphate aldolase [Aeromonas sp. BIGb0445]UBO75065.1 aldolase [Aeromonas rivuli]